MQTIIDTVAPDGTSVKLLRDDKNVLHLLADEEEVVAHEDTCANGDIWLSKYKALMAVEKAVEEKPKTTRKPRKAVSSDGD